MSSKLLPVPEHFKEQCAKASINEMGRPYYIDRTYATNIFWVTPIEDAQRNIMKYQNGVCLWDRSKEKSEVPE